MVEESTERSVGSLVFLSTFCGGSRADMSDRKGRSKRGRGMYTVSSQKQKDRGSTAA